MEEMIIVNKEAKRKIMTGNWNSEKDHYFLLVVFCTTLTRNATEDALS